MTTETTTAKKGWTPEEEAQITSIMETRKLNRLGAIQYLRRQSAKSVANQPPVELDAKLAALGDKAPHVAKPAAPKAKAKKAAAKPQARKIKSDLPPKSTARVKIAQEVLDDVIRKALRSAYGKPCPVLGVLGQRFAEPSKSQGYPYYRVLAETPDGLVAVFVSGFHDGGEPKASINSARKSSYTVGRLLTKLARIEKRAEAKAAREAK